MSHAVTLDDLGIERMQASRWMLLARMDENEFEAELDGLHRSRARFGEVSTTREKPAAPLPTTTIVVQISRSESMNHRQQCEASPPPSSPTL